MSDDAATSDPVAVAFAALCNRLVAEVHGRASVHRARDGDGLHSVSLSPHHDAGMGLTVIDRRDELGLVLLDTVGGWSFSRDDDGLERLESAARAVIAGEVVETRISYDHTRVRIECAPEPVQFDAVTPPELSRRWSLDRLRTAVRQQPDRTYHPY